MFGSIPADVRLILSDPAAAIAQFLDRQSIKSLRFFALYHLPFLILLPLFLFISPYRILRGHSFHLKSILGFPSLLILAFLVMAAVFDRMQRYSLAGGIDPARKDYFAMRPAGKNLALYLHIPVSASAFLFFFHPGLGYLGLFLTGFYCVYQSVIGWARLRHQSVLASLSSYILSAGLLMLPLLAMTILYNLLKTIRIFREIYS
ncbi:MAG: hypothetical protein KDK37_08700 [Leptospiraceae bacterium]|nr:hypothetical protein [Leptospiraceae bacterium]